MRDKSYKYPHGLSWFELTVLHLLWVIMSKELCNCEEDYIYEEWGF